MPAGQLLRRHVGSIGGRLLLVLLLLGLAVRGGRLSRLHFFTADDASAIGHLRQLGFRRVGVAPVHIAGSVVVANERAQTRDERPRGDKHIAYDVQG